MTQTADISTPKLVFVLIRATRSLTEFLEAGLAREGIHKPDFAILEALLHKGPLAIRRSSRRSPGDGSTEGGHRSFERARHGQRPADRGRSMGTLWS